MKTINQPPKSAHPPKPQMVLPCLFRANTTSIAVTVFLRPCSVQVTQSLTTLSRKLLITIRVSLQIKWEILLTPPRRASLLIEPLVIFQRVVFWGFLCLLLFDDFLDLPAIFEFQERVNLKFEFRLVRKEYKEEIPSYLSSFFHSSDINFKLISIC